MKSDTLAMLALARERYPDLPLYLLGESMGGAVALYSLTGRDTPADGIILIAPGVWSWRLINLLIKPALWLTAIIIPGEKVSDKTMKFESSDNKDVLTAMSEDPYVFKETRMDAAYGLGRMVRRGMKAAPGISVPTLLVYGENDELIPTEIMQKLWDKLPTEIRAKKHYLDGYHLLLRDCQAGVVWNDILEFLADRAGRELNLDTPASLCPPSLSNE